MFLIYDDESPAAMPEGVYEAYGRFTEMVNQRGVMRAGDPLERSDTATTVRVRGGKATTTDGPFAETKEILGGYYILDCKDLDEALEYAAQIPTATFGSIEVRPIREM
jgi:hypothetical protein